VCETSNRDPHFAQRCCSFRRVGVVVGGTAGMIPLYST
jgi:hypothetical protein